MSKILCEKIKRVFVIKQISQKTKRACIGLCGIKKWSGEGVNIFKVTI